MVHLDLSAALPPELWQQRASPHTLKMANCGGHRLIPLCIGPQVYVNPRVQHKVVDLRT